MKAYLLRITPKDTDRVADALASDTLIIGWSDIPECLGDGVTRDEVTRLIRERRFPNDTTLQRAGSAAGNLWRFVREMDIGDLVVVPHGDDIYFATVESAPFYLAEFVDQRMAYRRHAHWLNKDRPVARHSLPESLQSQARRQKTCSDISEVLDDIQAFLDSTGISWKNEGALAEEVINAARYLEGATRQIAVNSFERNAKARRRCIDHYGHNCSVCNFNFADVYGEINEDFIHVHHLIDLAMIGEEYEVDPVADLRPVCPNCHSMLHRTVPAMSIDELRAILAQRGR